MEREALERIARELATELPLPPGDWEAVLAQARSCLDTVRTLDELSLDAVEPPTTFRVQP